MQFDDTVRLVACIVVQAVEVLGDDALQELFALEFCRARWAVLGRAVAYQR